MKEKFIALILLLVLLIGCQSSAFVPYAMPHTVDGIYLIDNNGCFVGTWGSVPDLNTGKGSNPGFDDPLGETSLRGAYPNWHNGSQTISFVVEESTLVEVWIENVYPSEGLNRSINNYFDTDNKTKYVVRTLIDEIRPAGNHRLWWDGKDSEGNVCPSGFYRIMMRADGKTTHFDSFLMWEPISGVPSLD